MESSSDFLSYLQETELFPYVDGSKAHKLLNKYLQERQSIQGRGKGRTGMSGLKYCSFAFCLYLFLFFLLGIGNKVARRD